MKTNKRIIIIVILCLMFGFYCGWRLIIPHTHLGHSIQLVEAIKQKDIRKIEEIVQKDPVCVNTYPTITNYAWQALIGYHVSYPLNEACQQGNLEIIKMLVEAGANVNCNDGFTPLSLIYIYKKDNWYENSIYLLDSGASLNYKTMMHNSVLEDIVFDVSGGHNEFYSNEENEKIYQSFLYAVEHCDKRQIDWIKVFCDCVYLAGYERRMKIIHYLLDEGYCAVNDKMAQGMTPLMFAAMSGDIEAVKFLLSKGADRNLKDDEGKTALDYAKEYQREDIISLLKE